MKVRLVDIAAVRRHRGRALTRGEAVGRLVETDELGSAFRSETNLGSEPGPETLAAPADFGRHAFDPNPTPAVHQPSPGKGNLGVDRPSYVESRSQRRFRYHETVLPRPGCTESLPGSLSVAPPQVIQDDDRPA
jgi:hypothetical protein